MHPFNTRVLFSSDNCCVCDLLLSQLSPVKHWLYFCSVICGSCQVWCPSPSFHVVSRSSVTFWTLCMVSSEWWLMLSVWLNVVNSMPILSVCYIWKIAHCIQKAYLSVSSPLHSSVSTESWILAEKWTTPSFSGEVLLLLQMKCIKVIQRMAFIFFPLIFCKQFMLAKLIVN